MVKRVSSQPKPPHHLYVELQPVKARVRVLYDSVIEPEGANQVVLHLVNLLDYDEIPQRIVFWRLTSVSWKFEETIRHSFPLSSTIPHPSKRQTSQRQIFAFWPKAYCERFGRLIGLGEMAQPT